MLMQQTRTGLQGSRWAVAAILTCIAFTFSVVPTRADHPAAYQMADLKALEKAFVKLAEEVRPSVVAIRTYITLRDEHPGGRVGTIPHSQGSGFVIDSNGYIATNYHVIEDASIIRVILHDGAKYDADVVQGDRRRDLAVLKIDAENLQAVHYGDITKVRVNQWTFAYGNPLGRANRDGNTSVTYGTVSALGRHMTRALVGGSQLEYYGDLIETSSTIQPGNSGGPLFDVDGNVIGVIAAIQIESGMAQGAGYAIPIDRHTRRILDTLKAGQVVRYGFIGVEIEDVRPPRSRRVVDSRPHRGAAITRISPPDGPAGKAGLLRGDIVIEIDGTRVMDSDHLVTLIQYKQVGSVVEVRYLRRQVKRKMRITLGDRNELLQRSGG